MQDHFYHNRQHVSNSHRQQQQHKASASATAACSAINCAW